MAKKAILDEWRKQLNDHCDMDAFGPVIAYYGGYKPPAFGDPLKQFERTTFVMTTYDEIKSSWPNPKTTPEDDAESQISWHRHFEKKVDLLHRIHWHRVVLDEAHCIKNIASHCSRCCRALKSRFRWAITGTPIHNGTQELYPYFDFIACTDVANTKEWKRRYGDNAGRDQLFLEVQKYFIRRTHFDRFRGRHPLELPGCVAKDRWIDLGRHEQRINDGLYAQLHEMISQSVATVVSATDLRTKVPIKSADGIMAIMTKIRMINTHFLAQQPVVKALCTSKYTAELIRATGKDSFTAAEVETMVRLFKKSKTPQMPKRPAPDVQRTSDSIFAGDIESRMRKAQYKQAEKQRQMNKYKYWKKKGGKPLQSTRLRIIMSQLHDWLKDDPKKKIIVYTQWCDL